MDFLDYYRDNLGYIRGLAAEFASEFPKIAGRLSLSEFDCQDPYVERLLEGTAFLAARVEKKLDESYGRLLETILGSLAPDALYPVPSGAVLQLEPDYSLPTVSQGGVLPMGTAFDAFIPGINTPCRFSSFVDMPLSPLLVREAEYLTRDLSGFGIHDEKARAALYLKLESFGGEGRADTCFFLNMSDDGASRLLRQLMADSGRIYSGSSGSFSPLNGLRISLPFRAGSRSLFRELKGNIQGLRFLQDFMAYPAFFKFFTLEKFPLVRGLREILITFRRRDQSLATELKTGSLRLNCVPALNLFNKRSDRIPMERETYEYHVTPERAAMRDFEVLSVKGVEFFNERNEKLFSARGFYEDDLFKEGEQNFFSQHRRRTLFSTKAARRSSYDGSELFLTFSGRDRRLDEAYQFAAELVCTNRDLPLLLSGSAGLVTKAPLVKSCSFVTRPTRPDYSGIEQGEQSDFAKLGHLLYNLSAALWQEGDFPLEMFKTMLRNYRFRGNEETGRMVDGIVKIDRRTTAFRFVEKGALFFERGWKVDIYLDENAYAGIGYYLFACALAEMLRSFTPISSIVEINVYTQQSGYLGTWKTTLEKG
ncbi:MAG: type VI secretion system baseplate subunit TssF [Treponema sp.]|jgi:type VI secretion system VasI/ImpG family protein|nr:type VI secretion system baseplate subunit TssF [Treponema sp.]